jgi:hypothetical protein
MWGTSTSESGENLDMSIERLALGVADVWRSVPPMFHRVLTGVSQTKKRSISGGRMDFLIYR